MPEGPAGAPRLYNFGPFSRLTEEEIEREWMPCPEAGKEAKICKETKKAALAILEGQQVFAQCDTLEKINSGNCTKVADRVARNVPGTRVFKVGDNDHFWIEYNGRHYDAEVPTGVDDPLDFPIFNRIPPEATLRWAQMAAEQMGEPTPSSIEETIQDVTTER